MNEAEAFEMWWENEGQFSAIEGNAEKYDCKEGWQAALEWQKGQSETVQRNTLQTDALCQLSYCNGLKAGWNFCVDDNESGFQNAMKGVVEAVRALKESRSQETPPTAQINEQMREALQEFDDAFSEFNPALKSSRTRMRNSLIKAREALAAATPK